MEYLDWQIRAATDPEFRARLVADAKETLRSAGFDVPEGVSVRIEESTPQEIVLAIPPLLPEGAEVDEDALSETAAGSSPLCALTIFHAAVLGGTFTYKYVKDGHLN